MIVKLTSSGKAFQVVSDEGVVFQTSVEWVKGLLSGKSPKGFLLLTRMPFRVSKDRFVKSPVWNVVSGEKELDVDSSDVASPGLGSDVLSHKASKSRKEKSLFKDEVVW